MAKSRKNRKTPAEPPTPPTPPTRAANVATSSRTTTTRTPSRSVLIIGAFAVLISIACISWFYFGYEVHRQPVPFCEERETCPAFPEIPPPTTCPACPEIPPPTTCPACPQIPPPTTYCPAASNFTPPEVVSHVYNAEDDDDYDGVYHSWDLFKKSYAEMEKSFKVYIYQDGDPNTYYHTPRKLTGKYASEGNFFHHITGSQFRTEDPSQANMFFIPISCHKMRGKGISYTNMTLTVQTYVESLIVKYPYWNRSLGTDHFFVTCLDIGVKATEGIQFLAKNALRIVCASSGDLSFIPHKDISLPQVLLPHLLPGKDALKDRTNLAFWAGVWNHPIRKKLVQTWKNDKEIDVTNHPRNFLRGKKSIYRKFYINKFCICPRHHMSNTVRIADAIHYGCIPVIVSDHYMPPFSSILNWHKFSIKIMEANISALKKSLKVISDSQYALMHKNLVKVQKHFQWNTPPLKYDAFHMTMYELWMLRALY